MPKVIFKVPSYEKISKKVFFNVKDLKKNYRKVIYMKIPKQLVNDIIKKNFEEIKGQLIKEVKEAHDIEKLEKFKKELENYWNPLNNLFFDSLKKITGFDFKYKEYIVYISSIRRGSYSPTNEVFTNPKNSVRFSGYITAEELLHLHYWDIFKKLIKNVDLPWRLSKEIWEISETIPEFILTDESFEKFGWGKYLNRKYPFLKWWKKKINPFWKNKRNFKDFMIRVHGKLVLKIS